MKKLLFLAILISSFACVKGANLAVVDSLNVELSKATTTEDSLRLSVDLFDASNRLQQPVRAREALKLAQKLDDYTMQLDLIRNIANTGSSTDSIYEECLGLLKDIPDSYDKELTRLFIRIRQNSRAARNSTGEESRVKINELMNKVESSQGQSVKTRLQALFTLCAYLERIVSPELMSDYLEQIGELMKHLPEHSDAIEGLYLTQCALTYTSFYMNDKAVEADKKLLQHIDKLQTQYEANGRMHRDQAYSKYVIYRRLLANYPALTPEEIEYYYHKAKEMAMKDSWARHDFEKVRRPDIYYYMAHKDYARVLPLLKSNIFRDNKPSQTYIQRLLLNMIVEASGAIGNHEDQLKALLALRELDENEQTRQSVEQFHKLQVIYDRSNEKLMQAQLEIEKRDAEIAGHRMVLILGAIFLVILIGLLTVLTRVWNKSRRLNAQLEQTNVKLTDERDTLRRTQADLIRTGERARTAEKKREEFIDNMSHEVSTPLNAIVEYSQLIVDCVDADKNPYLTRFADVVKLNTDLLQLLFNDVLELSSIDKQTMKIECKPVAVGEIAQMAVDTIKSHIKPGVELISKIDPDDGTILNTDVRRVTQVLLNLLANAAKFTSEGSITLDGWLTADKRNYEFSVSDTGIGIPEGKEDIIFERFEKLNRYSQGIGLGLPVSRLVATLLGGDVVVDTTYDVTGSRFIFTIPVK